MVLETNSKYKYKDDVVTVEWFDDKTVWYRLNDEVTEAPKITFTKFAKPLTDSERWG